MRGELRMVTPFGEPSDHALAALVTALGYLEAGGTDVVEIVADGDVIATFDPSDPQMRAAIQNGVLQRYMESRLNEPGAQN